MTKKEKQDRILRIVTSWLDNQQPEWIFEAGFALDEALLKNESWVLEASFRLELEKAYRSNNNLKDKDIRNYINGLNVNKNAFWWNTEEWDKH